MKHVREFWHRKTPYVIISDLKKRIYFQHLDSTLYCREKISPQAFFPSVVPKNCLLNVVTGFGRNMYREGHQSNIK